MAEIETKPAEGQPHRMVCIPAEPYQSIPDAGVVPTEEDYHRVQQALAIEAGFASLTKLDLEMLKSLVRMIRFQRRRIRILNHLLANQRQRLAAQPEIKITTRPEDKAVMKDPWEPYL